MRLALQALVAGVVFAVTAAETQEPNKTCVEEFTESFGKFTDYTQNIEERLKPCLNEAGMHTLETLLVGPVAEFKKEVNEATSLMFSGLVPADTVETLCIANKESYSQSHDALYLQLSQIEGQCQGKMSPPSQPYLSSTNFWEVYQQFIGEKHEAMKMLSDIDCPLSQEFLLDVNRSKIEIEIPGDRLDVLMVKARENVTAAIMDFMALQNEYYPRFERAKEVAEKVRSDCLDQPHNGSDGEVDYCEKFHKKQVRAQTSKRDLENLIGGIQRQFTDTAISVGAVPVANGTVTNQYSGGLNMTEEEKDMAETIEDYYEAVIENVTKIFDAAEEFKSVGDCEVGYENMTTAVKYLDTHTLKVEGMLHRLFARRNFEWEYTKFGMQKEELKRAIDHANSTDITEEYQRLVQGLQDMLDNRDSIDFQKALEFIRGADKRIYDKLKEHNEKNDPQFFEGEDYESQLTTFHKKMAKLRQYLMVGKMCHPDNEEFLEYHENTQKNLTQFHERVAKSLLWGDASAFLDASNSFNEAAGDMRTTALSWSKAEGCDNSQNKPIGKFYLAYQEKMAIFQYVVMAHKIAIHNHFQNNDDAEKFVSYVHDLLDKFHEGFMHAEKKMDENSIQTTYSEFQESIVLKAYDWNKFKLSFKGYGRIWKPMVDEKLSHYKEKISVRINNMQPQLILLESEVPEQYRQSFADWKVKLHEASEKKHRFLNEGNLEALKALIEELKSVEEVLKPILEEYRSVGGVVKPISSDSEQQVWINRQEDNSKAAILANAKRDALKALNTEFENASGHLNEKVNSECLGKALADLRGLVASARDHIRIAAAERLENIVPTIKSQFEEFVSKKIEETGKCRTVSLQEAKFEAKQRIHREMGNLRSAAGGVTEIAALCRVPLQANITTLANHWNTKMDSIQSVEDLLSKSVDFELDLNRMEEHIQYLKETCQAEIKVVDASIVLEIKDKAVVKEVLMIDASEGNSMIENMMTHLQQKEEEIKVKLSSDQLNLSDMEKKETKRILDFTKTKFTTALREAEEYYKQMTSILEEGFEQSNLNSLKEFYKAQIAALVSQCIEAGGSQFTQQCQMNGDASKNHIRRKSDEESILEAYESGKVMICKTAIDHGFATGMQGCGVIQDEIEAGAEEDEQLSSYKDEIRVFLKEALSDCQNATDSTYHDTRCASKLFEGQNLVNAATFEQADQVKDYLMRQMCGYAVSKHFAEKVTVCGSAVEEYTLAKALFAELNSDLESLQTECQAGTENDGFKFKCRRKAFEWLQKMKLAETREAVVQAYNKGIETLCGFADAKRDLLIDSCDTRVPYVLVMETDFSITLSQS